MKTKISLALLVIMTSLFAYGQEICLLCKGAGYGRGYIDVNCGMCNGQGVMGKCFACGGAGEVSFFGMTIPCTGCNGSGHLLCMGCGGQKVHKQHVPNAPCDACNGERYVSPQVNFQIRIMLQQQQMQQMQMMQQMQQMQMDQMNNRNNFQIPKREIGVDRKCGACGTTWYAYPGAMSCPQCSAPKYH